MKIVTIIASKAGATLYSDVGERIGISIEHPDYKLMDKAIEVIIEKGSWEYTPSNIKPTEELNKAFKDIEFFKLVKHQGECIDALAKSNKEIVDLLSKYQQEMQSNTELVAVTNNTIIPINNLQKYIDMAVSLGSTQGVECFIKRLAKMINQRNHSVEDVIEFLKKGDLPIADDGTIIAYKVLKITNDPAVFADCHTGRVMQKVGTKVFMKEELVDPNRKTECSCGLHIARRQYIKNFARSGTVCVLCKIAPEDVIAVPEQDPNKVRVKAYHIVAKLSEDEYKLIRNNKPITNIQSGKVRLKRVMDGNHVGIFNTVEITSDLAHSMETTEIIPLKEQKEPKKAKVSTKKVKALDTYISKDIKNQAQIAKTINKAINAESPTKRIRYLLKHCALTKDVAYEIADLKKKSKKSWEYLGADEKDVRMIKQLTQ